MSKKRTVRLTETEMVNLIERIVNEVKREKKRTILENPACADGLRAWISGQDFGAREKKATSAPEISAEQNNNRIMIIKLSTMIDIGSKAISKKRLSKSGLNSSSNFGVIYLER